MADRANGGIKKFGPSRQGLPITTVVGQPSADKAQLTSVQLRAARMMAKGQPIPLIARKLADYIVQHEADREVQLKKARNRIRSWARSQAFRDALWEEALTMVDQASGEILEGLTGAAIRGRVDAARLIFEISGRHSPHTDIQPAQVNVVLGELPRPKSIESAEVVDVDAEVEPDDLG
jgi:hypothetical protein